MLTSIARSARLLSTGAGLRRATHLHHSTGSSSSCCCCCCCYTTATLAWNRPSKDDSTATTTTTTSNTSTTITGGGIGLHNVRDQVLVSARSSEQSQPPHAAPPPSRACTVIGVPMTYGQPYVGTDTSPHQLRQSGLISKLQQLSWQVKDSGNLPFDAYISDALKAPETLSKRQEALQTFHGNAKNMFEVGIGTHQLAQLVASTLQDATTPQFPLILGGDHSIAIGSLAGLLQVHPDLGVLWIDAHADINTPYITESGNMHGMPIGFLMDPIMERTFQQFRVNQKMITADASSWTVPGFEWLQHEFKNRLKPNQLVYVGLRDVDIEERKLITSLGIQAYTMTDIDRAFLVLFEAFAVPI